MRVISGTAKGRPLKAVPGVSTRPTTDKVKEAIFSMIGPYFDGGQVLDLFAGTGGLGIEALSRGMDKAVFIDIEKKSIDTIQHNLQAAGLKDQAEIYRTDAARALKALAKRDQQFQLVFLDPPYKMKVIADLIGAMEEYAIVGAETTIVVEHDAKDVQEDGIGQFRQQRRADYGDTAVTIYKPPVE
ncbi:16S rRNA (guanine(966)-N(2))-methyltransferase RsmD [Paenibacillus sp. GCM10023248]|uniref:16S rRNA (guanine(966)-N(2))-methyltransferase RsmD n=1 Tax=unclassified Paenibacillus TaxID=185978 RepID=UPI002378BC62|nr:16S rRNA (guanine(966)-N(2))-methyltransferase RsmD [Paenibacillus sp. MAHUQ-63]MDD9270240.1 16S rRNA (guanine(966)-N(2))-methyltransferase RsmD [Paenibacillus sp. MAHUQ-63]